MRRLRVILYEGDEAQMRRQFEKDGVPIGLVDGKYQLGTDISIATVTDPAIVEALLATLTFGYGVNLLEAPMAVPQRYAERPSDD